MSSSVYPSLRDDGAAVVEVEQDDVSSGCDSDAYVKAPCPGQVPQIDNLRDSNKRFRRRLLCLAVLIAVAVVILIASVCVLFHFFPAIRFYSWSTSEEASRHLSRKDGGELCQNVFSDYIDEAWFKLCSNASAGPCYLDVRTALCLLTTTKADLDRRTTRLDVEVYQSSKILHQLMEKLQNSSIRKKTNVFYDQRASAHFSWYYSHEATRGKHHTIAQLQWKGNSGLSAVRDMEEVKANGKVIGFRVTQPGYYYIYSHVAYDPKAAANRIHQHYFHSIYKNYSGNPGKRSTKLLHSRSVDMNHVSYLQGVFLLRVNDTISVRAERHLLNKQPFDRTFFGAFSI